MRVRIIRSVSVKPEMSKDFWKISLGGAEYVQERTGIRPGVFWVRHGSPAATDAKIFMDFDSMAQYEELFLHGLLYDAKYLTLAEQSLPMINREPSDELLVLMDKDDFFMNFKDGTKQEPANLPRNELEQRRYRLCRHVDVTAGRLRDFMRQGFNFIDQFENIAGFRPQLFCTRFTAERIGCTKMYFDYDDCPMCDSTLIEFNQVLLRDFSDVVDAVQPDELYVQVNAEDLNFNLFP